jgi:hypothetical protein
MDMELAQGPGEGACELANTACASTEDIVAGGDVTCEVTWLSDRETGCSSTGGCTRQVTVDGIEFGVQELVGADCERQDEHWTCTCSHYAQSANLTVEALDSAQACTVAANRCPEVMDVPTRVFGGYNSQAEYDEWYGGYAY